MLFILVVDPSSTLIRGRDDELMIAARALQKQLNEQVCPAWDRAQCEVIYEPDPNRLLEDEPHGFPLVLLDAADVPGVLGYHVEAGARIFIKPSFDAGSDILSGPYAISGVIAHEAFETLGDRMINYWADMPGGQQQTALELADAVEHDACPISLDDGTTVMGSNFLLPAWFNKDDAAGPFDQLGQLKGPFTMTAGGYLIVREAVSGSEKQVFGEAHPVFGPAYPSWKKQIKHQHGRHARKHQHR